MNLVRMMASHTISSKHSILATIKDLKYDLKQNSVNCGSISSLKYCALCSIAGMLWQNKLRLIDFRKLRASNIFDELKYFKNDVLDQVSLLEIPLTCKEDLENIFDHILWEISDYFNHVKFNYFPSVDSLKVFMNNICWTQQGTINKLKTATKIIEHSNLGTKEKYLLACNHCIEDKIRSLVKLLPENYFKLLLEDLHGPLVLAVFWSLYVKGTHLRLTTYTGGIPICEYIMRWAISHQIEVAVQFIWENFADDATKDCIIDFVKITKNSNILLYLLTQMNETQLKEVGNDAYEDLLEKLYSIDRWCKDLPVNKCMMDLIKSKNVFDAFEFVLNFWHNRRLSLHQYSILWKEFGNHYKLDIEKNFVEICETYFDEILRIKSDIATAKLLIQFGTSEDKKELMYGDDAMLWCIHLLYSRGLHVMNRFINLMLNGDEIFKFKIILYNKENIHICNTIMAKGKLEWFKEIFIEFCTKNVAKEIKDKISYIGNTETISSLSLPDDDLFLLTAVDKFLSCCFEGNEKKIARYKEVAFNLETDVNMNCKSEFFKKLSELITQKKWKLVEKYWKWIYSATENQISSSNDKLARIKKILYLTSQELGLIKPMKFVECYGLLRKFITSCFKYDEINELKETLMYSIDIEFLVRDMLVMDRSEDVKSLLDWCYSCENNKINDFKLNFMLSYGCTLLFALINNHDFNIGKVLTLLKWFNPTVESGKLFKPRFITFVTNKRNIQLQQINQNGIELRKFEKDWTMVNERMTIILESLIDVVKENMLIEKTQQEFINVDKSLNFKRKTSMEQLISSKKIKLSDRESNSYI